MPKGVYKLCLFLVRFINGIKTNKNEANHCMFGRNLE